eukprot:TRINITY_DN22452_c0_g1_i1.p1 TRINITY_DN22452_c0_g1~~TRINITY_DN22452_c0_g1_i1.p1  ORF type:complete len:1146 (+),score=194.01 TRINITY_DN22452_c0_g1_i1:140-3577(+)
MVGSASARVGTSAGSPDEVRTGVQFGPDDDLYEVDDELGSGAAARVFACRRLRTGEELAVKAIDVRRLRLLGDCEGHLTRLDREVRILRRLRHKRIVELRSVYRTDSWYFLVMERVRGGELFSHIVRQGRLSDDEARHVFQQLLEGVAYMHSRDVIHRDLKPENILIVDASPSCDDSEVQVKIADFGLSKVITDGASAAKTFVGTPQYWAPEVLRVQNGGGTYGHQADLWGLGAVLFVMLSGRYPFCSQKVPLEEQIQTAKYNMKTTRWRGVSEDAKNLIRSLLRVAPQERLCLEDCLRHPWVVGSSSSHPAVASTHARLTKLRVADEATHNLSPCMCPCASPCPSSLHSSTRLDSDNRQSEEAGATDRHADVSAERLLRRPGDALDEQMWRRRSSPTALSAQPPVEYEGDEREEDEEDESEEDREEVLAEDSGAKEAVTRTSACSPIPKVQKADACSRGSQRILQQSAFSCWDCCRFLMSRWLRWSRRLSSHWPFYVLIAALLADAASRYGCRQSGLVSSTVQEQATLRAADLRPADELPCPTNHLGNMLPLVGVTGGFSVGNVSTPASSSAGRGGTVGVSGVGGSGLPDGGGKVGASTWASETCTVSEEETVFRLQELLRLQVSISGSLELVAIALRHADSELAERARSTYEQARDLFQKAANLVSQFAHVANRVSNTVLPDMQLAVQEQEPGLALTLLVTVKEWVSDMKRGGEDMRTRYAQLHQDVLAIATRAQRTKAGTDQRLADALQRVAEARVDETIATVESCAAFHRICASDLSSATCSARGPPACAALTSPTSRATPAPTHIHLRSIAKELFDEMTDVVAGSGLRGAKGGTGGANAAATSNAGLGGMGVRTRDDGMEEWTRDVTDLILMAPGIATNSELAATRKSCAADLDDDVEVALDEVDPPAGGRSQEASGSRSADESAVVRYGHDKEPSREAAQAEAETSAALLRALRELRRVGSILQGCSAFWVNMDGTIERLAQMKDHTEALVRSANGSVRLQERFTRRLEEYAGFWHGLEWLGKRYSVQHQAFDRKMQEFVSQVRDATEVVDTAAIVHTAMSAASAAASARLSARVATAAAGSKELVPSTSSTGPVTTAASVGRHVATPADMVRRGINQEVEMHEEDEMESEIEVDEVAD